MNTSKLETSAAWRKVDPLASSHKANNRGNSKQGKARQGGEIKANAYVY